MARERTRKKRKRRSKYIIGQIVIYMRKAPRYADGWKMCSKCKLAFKPSVPLPSFNRCPFCGSLLRSRNRSRDRSKGVMFVEAKG